MPVKPNKVYFISAGEFSGDLLAAELAHSLKRLLPDYHPIGVAGDVMIKAGVTPIAHLSQLSVMGIIEVARKISDLRMLEQLILASVDRIRPEFAVFVDFPGFHFRLAEQFKLRGIPVYQYVAPKLWAWGSGRAKNLRDNFQAVLGVLPFEEEFFLRHGVNYKYVGSPHFDRVHKLSVRAEDMGIKSDHPIIAFLPGSRMSEIQSILPVMIKIRTEIRRINPDVVCAIPLASGISWEDVTKIIADDCPEDPRTPNTSSWEAAGFTWFRGQSIELMKIAPSALVASGTATLECALAGTPMSVIYAMNDLSLMIAKKIVKLRWFSLVNLLMNCEVVKEHLQHFDPRAIAEEVLELAQDSERRRRMVDLFQALSSKLQPGASDNAARLIAHEASQRRQAI